MLDMYQICSQILITQNVFCMTIIGVLAVSQVVFIVRLWYLRINN